jgi:hypothetical protein
MAVPAAASSFDLRERAWRVSDASLSWLQWIAVAAMLIDHFNWFFFAHGGDPRSTAHVWMNDIGRLAFPLFAFVFGVNLARVLDAPEGAARMARLLRRAVAFGVVAQVPYWALRGYFFPLNVLWTFALSAAVCWSWERSTGNTSVRVLAVVAFVLGGLAVEYWWFGLAAVIASVGYARTRTVASFCFVVAAFAGLAVLNWNAVTLLALLPIVLLAQVGRAAPRRPGLLYWLYAGHLWAFLAAVAMVGGLT